MWIFPESALLLVAALITGSQGIRPTITSDVFELIIDEGQPIKIICKSWGNMQLIHPNNSNYSITSSPKEKRRNVRTLYTHIFEKSKTDFRDTGWYDCASNTTDVNRLDTTNDTTNENPGISKIYIYVKSETNLLAEYTKNDTSTIVGIQKTIAIACRPTAPDYNVSLIANGTMLQLSERITYDPRSGFAIQNAAFIDSGKYECIAEHHGTQQIMNYSIHVTRTDELSLQIINETVRHITHGQTVNLNCTVKAKSDVPLDIFWIRHDERITNNQNERISFRLFVENTKPYRQTTTTLVIKDFSNDDQGLYECLSKQSSFEPDKVNITLTISDEKYINLSSHSETDYFEKSEGDSIHWIVDIDGYPEDFNITWSDPDTKEIIGTWNNPTTDKFAMKKTTVSTELMINNLNIHNMGVYKLQVQNSYDIKELQFTLAVKSTPSDITIAHEVGKNGYFIPGTIAKLTCEAYAFPEPNFEWSFVRSSHPSDRPSYLLTSSSQMINRSIASLQPSEATQVSETSPRFRSAVSMKMIEDGNIVCRVCNPHCGSSTKQLWVSEVPGGFAIIAPPKVVVGNDFNLTCAASITNHSSLKWLEDYDGSPIILNDRMSIIEEKDFNTYRLILAVQKAQKSDNKKYICKSVEMIEYDLKVYDSEENVKIEDSGEHRVLFMILAILLIICCGVSICTCIKMRRGKTLRKELIDAGLTHFEEGAPDCLNPELTVDDQAEFLPYDRKFEFSRSQLTLGKQLGSGAFGVVMKAEARGIREDEEVTTVAVKTVRRSADATNIRALASELKIMIYLGKHPNVVNLLGACTNNIMKRELLVIVEYCQYGNLHNYLLRHRSTFLNQIDPKTGKLDLAIGNELLDASSNGDNNRRLKYADLSFSRSLSGNAENDSADKTVAYHVDAQKVSMPINSCDGSTNPSQPGWGSNYHGDYQENNLKPICTQDLLFWAFQVARGMEYLSQRKVLHGDLAARNILLAENSIVKICDFGLAKTMYKDNNYKKQGDGPLPIKWMAIESIRDRVFSTQSDVWSFGIVLWEFFTLANTPYPGMEAEEQYRKLMEGYRMEKPEYATKEVYDIMLRCWRSKPVTRPTFTELVDSFGDLLEDSVRSHHIELNTPYLQMNTSMNKGVKDDISKMVSSLDHTTLSVSMYDYVNCSLSQTTDQAHSPVTPATATIGSIIYCPQTNEPETHFKFPAPATLSGFNDELKLVLSEEDDNLYGKSINIQENKAEFTCQQQALKQNESDESHNTNYCNAPSSNLHAMVPELKSRRKTDGWFKRNSPTSDKFTSKVATHKVSTPQIIESQDNYVNMPKQKNELRGNVPKCFSNPSYLIMSDTNQA